MPTELVPGTLVRVRAAIDYQPYCTIPEGAAGIIVSTTVATVLVSWFMTIKGLERWNNVAMLEYYEALEALEVDPIVCDERSILPAVRAAGDDRWSFMQE